MANIDQAFTADQGLSLDDQVGIFHSDNDPTIGGEVAPMGSLLLLTSGQAFLKTGIADIAWSSLPFASVTPRVNARHNGAITQTVSSTQVSVLFGSNIRSDSSLTYNSIDGEFVVNEAGTYQIICDGAATGASNTRTIGQWVIQIDGVDVPGSVGFSYHRNTSLGDNSCTIRSSVVLSVGQLIRIRVNSQGNNITTIAEGCRLFITKE